MTNSAFFSGDIPFASFSQTHIATLIFSLGLLILLIVVGRNLTRQQNLLIGRCLSVFLSLTVILFIVFHIQFDALILRWICLCLSATYLLLPRPFCFGIPILNVWKWFILQLCQVLFRLLSRLISMLAFQPIGF